MNSTLFCPTSISPVRDTRTNCLVGVTEHTASDRATKHVFVRQQTVLVEP